MTEVIPAILTKTYDEMKEQIAQVLPCCHIVQIDFCDGKFVPSKTWPYADRSGGNDPMNDPHFFAIINEEEGLPYWEDMDYEIHLMVYRAHKMFDTILKLGPKKVLFQLEAEIDIEVDSPLTRGLGVSLQEFKEFLEGIDMYTRENIEIGISINPTTPIENLVPFISNIDYVQCMGIAVIGSQGQPFDERVFKHIEYLRNNYPELIIAVDGSVNAETAPRLVDAGVKRLVIGSALMKSFDIEETYREFESL